MQDEPALLRIGGVSAQSGVPVATLRVWESRYGAFQPRKTGGSHRLYTEADVLRATLLRQLTAAGHAISTVARLDAPRLSELLHGQRATRSQRQAVGGARSVRMAVVGLPLASRLQTAGFLDDLGGVTVRVTDTVNDLADAQAHTFGTAPDLLLVRVNSLQPATHTALRHLVEQHRIAQVIVLYGFGPQRVVEALKHSGMIVRREPIPDSELADLIRSQLLVDSRPPLGAAQPGLMIPPRKYSDQTLARVANISTNVLCECPRHVAELITQLASFEQYSQDCLNNSLEDAHLHARLSAVSGSARALFEQALELVAQHEGIALDQL